MVAMARMVASVAKADKVNKAESAAQAALVVQAATAEPAESAAPAVLVAMAVAVLLVALAETQALLAMAATASQVPQVPMALQAQTAWMQGLLTEQQALPVLMAVRAVLVQPVPTEWLPLPKTWLDWMARMVYLRQPRHLPLLVAAMAELEEFLVKRPMERMECQLPSFQVT
jgi:hypothetical protein